jgi:4-hydroxyphenylacetate 3-monooxygenase
MCSRCRRCRPDNSDTRDAFETYWSVPGQSAKNRMKLFKLAWDLLGSDFAGRHMQYEKFYAGLASL